MITLRFKKRDNEFNDLMNKWTAQKISDAPPSPHQAPPQEVKQEVKQEAEVNHAEVKHEEVSFKI